MRLADERGCVRPALLVLSVGVGVSLALGGLTYAWLRDVHDGWRVYRELHRREHEFYSRPENQEPQGAPRRRRSG